MPYVGQDYDPQDPGEVLSLSLDFKRELSPGETLTAASWTCAASDGVDASAAQRVVSATFSGTVVTAGLQNGVAGVTYRHLARVTTSKGQQLQLWSHCLVSAPA
jgi:hypothetical protein